MNIVQKLDLVELKAKLTSQLFAFKFNCVHTLVEDQHFLASVFNSPWFRDPTVQGRNKINAVKTSSVKKVGYVFSAPMSQEFFVNQPCKVWVLVDLLAVYVALGSFQLIFSLHRIRPSTNGMSSRLRLSLDVTVLICLSSPFAKTIFEFKTHCRLCSNKHREKVNQQAPLATPVRRLLED